MEDCTASSQSHQGYKAWATFQLFPTTKSPMYACIIRLHCGNVRKYRTLTYTYFTTQVTTDVFQSQRFLFLSLQLCNKSPPAQWPETAQKEICFQRFCMSSFSQLHQVGKHNDKVNNSTGSRNCLDISQCLIAHADYWQGPHMVHWLGHL